jgi:two-component system sensor kinase FixL
MMDPAVRPAAPGRILIVEDEAVIARDIQGQLTRLGYEVCAVAASGREAIAAAGRHRPDIALMDVVLSGDMDGIQTAEAIAELYQTSVVFLTAYADGPTLQRAKHLNPLGYIVKPCSERELSIVVEIALHREAAQRQVRKAEAALRMSEARSRTVIQTAVDGIIIIDEQGIMQSFNPAAERIFGYQAEEMVGRNVSMLMPEALQLNHDRHMCAYLDTGVAKIIGINREVEGRRSDGNTIPLDLSIAAWSVDGRRYFTVTMRDVTERKRIEQALQQRNIELARANARLDQFAHMIGHDFRTPLRAVRNSAQWIVEDLHEHPSEEIRGHVARITEHTARMYAMLDDLLVYAHAGIDAAAPREVHLATLIDEIRRHLEPAAKVHIEIAGPVEAFIAARAAIAIVFRNLIENAVRHTDRDTASIRISCHEDAQDLRFALSDDGPGIAPEHHARIFAPFTTVGPPRSAQGATGMGLTLVKRVIENNGGTIAVESDPAVKRGTTIRFSWAKLPSSLLPVSP